LAHGAFISRLECRIESGLILRRRIPHTPEFLARELLRGEIGAASCAECMPALRTAGVEGKKVNVYQVLTMITLPFSNIGPLP
jgi:hypothetical protein